jgi:hypothetical protein
MSPARRSGARAAKPTDDMLSAMVIVRAASGRRLAGSDVIDATTLPAHVAAPADVSATQHACEAHGFTVGPYVGISFAITARQSQFENAFAVQLKVGRNGAVAVTRQGRALGQELPLDHLSTTLRERIETVTFTPPVDLHDAFTML